MMKFEYGQPGVMRLVKNHKLVEPRNCEEQYVAISHTWGQKWKDFPGIEWKVPTWVSETTLKELTKRFGKLWIDGLCIRQNDERDVLLQIKKMGSYYRQAQKVIVLFNDDNWKKSLKALRKSAQLLLRLKEFGENRKDFFDCFPNCEYANLLRELKANIEIASRIEWFKSVWTIQEAILAKKITFIGIQQEHIEINVFTDEEFKDFVKKFDLISDVNSSAWLGGITHLCLNNLNPLEIAELSQKLAEKVRPLNIFWYKDISNKHDSFLTKKYTFEMIRSQLGSRSRTCREDWDLIYGIAGILEIDYLQTRINELINLNKEKTERIFNALSHLLPEKDLLGRLVKTHLELIKYKNQNLKDSNYGKQKKKDERQILSLKDQLEEKLTEEQMNNLESILDDFEKLINQELEIENKLIQKQSLIENHKQTSLMIDNSEIWKIVSLEEVVQDQQIQSLKGTNSAIQEIAFWQGQAIAYKEIALNSSQSFIDQLLADFELLQQNPEVLQKINHLLGIKRNFLQARESTITKLQATCDLLEEANIGKYARIEEASKALSASGKLTANWLPLNIIEPLGDSATVFNARKKRKFAIKNSQAFQQLLTEEEKNLELFKEAYKKLLAFLPRIDKEEEPSLFSRCYQIYEVATNLWKDKKHIETSDMKDAIAALQTNLLDLQTELKSQENSLAKLNTSQHQALVIQTPR